MLPRFFLVICSVFAFVEWHTADTLFYFSCVCAKCAGFGLGIVFDANRSLGDFERTRRKKLGVNEDEADNEIRKDSFVGGDLGSIADGSLLVSGLRDALGRKLSMGNVAVRGNVAVSYFDFRSHLCPSRVPGDECTECASSSSVSSSRWLLLVLPTGISARA